MLQAPPQVSRVCGHGHIKKFWLMQTQRENQGCDNVVAVSSPSSSRNVNIGSSMMKSMDLRSSPTHSSYGEQPTGKHSSMSCAESLSPPRQVSKTSSRVCMDGDNEVCTKRTRCSPEHFASRLSEDNSSSPSRSISSKSSVELDVKQRGSDGSMSTHDASRSNFEGSTVQSEKNTYASSNPSSKRPSGDNRPMSVMTSPQMTYTNNREKLAEGKFGSFKKPSVVLPDNSLQDASCENSPLISDALHNPSPKACSLCGTTKTPMWRSGPQGPKSLCNACGIRFKKYRSFPGQSETSELMMHSVGSSRYVARQLKRKQGSCIPPYESCKSDVIDIKSSVQDVDFRHQKKSKWQELALKQALARDTSSSTWKLSSGPPCFKKIYGCVLPLHSKLKKLVPMDEHSNSVFAKDEEEAAVLLMHLSCGLVY